MISLPIPTEENPIIRLIQAALPALNMDTGPWVAGGSARLLAENIGELGFSDIDVFFPSEEIMKWTRKYLSDRMTTIFDGFFLADQKETPASYQFIFHAEDDMAATGQKYVIQLVKKRYYESTEVLFADFDFTICMFATDGYELVGEDSALADAKNRRLVLSNNPPKPKAARLAKYCAHGFIPTEGVITAMFGVNTERFCTQDLKQDEY